MSLNWIGPALLVAGPLAVAFGLALRRRANDRALAFARAETEVDRAELFSLQSGWNEAVELARGAQRVLGARRDRAAAVLRARACLVLAECEAGLDRHDRAHEYLKHAADARVMAGEDPAVPALLAAERLMLAGVGSPAGAPTETHPGFEEVLGEAESDSAPAANAPRLIRLARLAIGQAEIRMREGSWPGARSALEQAVRFGERVPAPPPPALAGAALERAQLLAGLARGRASFAAGEIGQVLATLGQAVEARAWLDRSVATLEGTALPPAQMAMARALVVRAMSESPDEDPGGEARARLLRRARDVVADCDWPAARAIGARAEIQMGVLRAQQGGEGAAGHFRAASARLDDLEMPGAAELVAEARLLLGHLVEEHGQLDEARTEYRRALDAGREDADPDARRLAAVAGCHLHRLLHHADRADEARALLDVLEPLAPTVATPARALLSAMVARCRGQQQFRDGDAKAADRTLEGAMTLIEGVEGPEALDLARQISAERGALALAGDEALEAETQFRRALGIPPGSRPPAIEQAERAELHLRLAQSLLHLERVREALPELRRAFEDGRDSGRANGRAVAAAAALTLGDHPESPVAERRGWYESAARFGKLSGTARGSQVAEAVEERLRELKD